MLVSAEPIFPFLQVSFAECEEYFGVVWEADLSGPAELEIGELDVFCSFDLIESAAFGGDSGDGSNEFAMNNLGEELGIEAEFGDECVGLIENVMGIRSRALAVRLKGLKDSESGQIADGLQFEGLAVFRKGPWGGVGGVSIELRGDGGGIPEDESELDIGGKSGGLIGDCADEVSAEFFSEAGFSGPFEVEDVLSAGIENESEPVDLLS